ncbi:MAG: carbohydrate porin [Gammaproteobacteria bacterium]|nr:carbohydrate porin [Gammaproteobacteria bacterium]MBQ0838267.1 carbohydrate porin [Gammaproteobacteria bacterium]
MIRIAKARPSWCHLPFNQPLGFGLQRSLLIAALVTCSSQALAAGDDREALLKRIVELEAKISRMDSIERRLRELETTAVLSDPETYVSKVEIFVDDDGVEHPTKQPGSHSVVTYQRERVYRRQTINEKIEDALSGDASSRVQVGVDAAITMQYANQQDGDGGDADGEFYQLASMDLYFTAELAKNTIFYADIVGLSGTTPGSEIGGLTDINGYTARLRENDDQLNDLSLREAWLQTQLFDQQLSLTIGRIDLTSFFDGNAVANDETSQFLSDALVNNPMLGLSENGAGMAGVYDPKNGFTVKLGYQQSDSTATNLSDSLFQMAEVGYQFNPFGTGVGNYRAWYRSNNNDNGGSLSGYGLSLDQKVSAGITVFGRYGEAETLAGDDDEFFSGGVQFSDGFGFNPNDVWGLGFANTVLGNDDEETLFEGYYTMSLAERLALSFHLTYIEEEPDGADDFSYLVPGFRLQASY